MSVLGFVMPAAFFSNDSINGNQSNPTVPVNSAPQLAAR
jgi:hypothetical protein